MNSYSLKKKILLSVVLALVIVVGLLSWYSYFTQKALLLQSSVDSVRQTGKQQADRIEAWLADRQRVIASLANKVDGDTLNALQQAQASGDFQLTYYGDRDGVMVDSDPRIDRTGYDPRIRPWYQQAQQARQGIITKPYLDVAFNLLVVSIAQPARNGVVGGDVSIASIVDSVSNMSLPANGHAIMIHDDGTVIAYKDASKLMGKITNIESKLNNRLIESSNQAGQLTPVYFETENSEKLLWSEKISNTDWQLIFVLDKQTLEAPLVRLMVTQLGLATIALIVSVLSISWLLTLLLGPLSRVSQALSRIAEGNGDLTQRIRVDSQDEVRVLADSFNSFVSSQHQLISHIRQLAIDLDLDAEKSLLTNHSSVEELERQQQEVTMVATAVTEMSSATHEIAANAENTAAASQQSAQSSIEGKSLVDKTRTTINSLASEIDETTVVIGELSQHAQAISSILTTIQEIAEQTNLLALNAAIEAARAGEQGRGFAVVADEVRVLSHRTQNSTAEIYTTIETLQNTTKQAVSLMGSSKGLASNSVDDVNAAAKALDEITQAVNEISDMAGQIAVAAEEQTQVTNEITRNTVAIKDVTDEITSSATDHLSQAKILKDRAANLNEKVATFIL
ncbi:MULTISPECIES: methyl-accepting chemotaxis protein [unclassified Pseudoalteromonas]|uniref:methyl-accepting chemotaxis protein n=1 Tax=unclassified Pseudoalteromonas TaxID=194690 RepID=UPI0025B47DA9|nr:MULTISPECIES: methyl-accepting chemotaxis protein [unclassified Pseudoalteromonas]MDN3380120.1 methyl-accepting chemotaxis protein [Pseudoalteromonas sp. APC 3893]MDN3386693.1 methyl-accepting chemotaxis protein [Pseudoalteromonas sp. APC 4017]